MAGRTIIGIEGERFPRIGDTMTYKVIFDVSVNPTDIKDEDIKWQLYWADEFSEYKEVDFSRLKIGKETTYKFLNNLANKNLQLKVSYKNEKAELHIVPTMGDSKIIDVFFLNNEYKPLQTIPPYGQGIILQMYTVNMKGRYINFNVYDVVNGKDVVVGKNNQPLRIEQNNGIVKSEQIILNIGMPLQTQKDMDSEQHQYKVKIWEHNNETNVYEEPLKVRNQQSSYQPPQDTQAPQKTGLPEPKPKNEDKKDDKKCFCEKEFSEDDIKAFYNSKQLFTHKKCPLPAEQKTYKAFTLALNKAMKEYDINTCLRKAHFLAQVQVESDSLNTTIEYATGWDYDHSTHFAAYNTFRPYVNYKKDKKLEEALKKKYTPQEIKKLNRDYERYNECIRHGHTTKGDGPKYKGRGLLQLTWKDTYEAYFAYIKHSEYITSPDMVANSIENACNASAWYWKYRSQWGNLNIPADNDDVYYINFGVNGGFNHFDVRINNIKKILGLMKVKERCKNITNLKKELGKYKYSTSGVKDKKYGQSKKSTLEKYDD